MIANLDPGIYNFSAEVYHADPCPQPSLSSSIAGILLEQSPAHAWLAHPRLNPNFERHIDSEFDLGSAAHALLLERDESRIVYVPARDWRTNAAKEMRAQAHADNKFAVLETRAADLQEMVAVARAYVQGTELAGILDADAERTLIWREGDLWCRARPDLMSEDRRVLLDFKSTKSAAPEAVARVISSLWYDLQAQFYLHGLRMLIGRADAEFIFLFQETKPPYCCSLIGLANAYKEVGDRKVKRALEIWGVCMEKQSWRGYSNEILYCEPRPWDLTEIIGF